MGNLLFWSGIGAAQKGAGSKPIERRHWVASLVVGILIALLIGVVTFRSVGQPTMKPYAPKLVTNPHTENDG
jgi:hypothetical protein